MIWVRGQNIERGHYQVVIVNPEIAFMHKGRFEDIWKNKAFAASLIMVVFDEAHCVSVWGKFRPQYKHTDRLRGMLKSHVPFLLPSATLPAHVQKDVLNILKVLPDDVKHIHLSNDWPNVYLSVRMIQHSLTSYKDLDFLIPNNWEPGMDIPKFLVFFDNIEDAVKAADALRDRLPPEYREKVVWFSANNTPEFREGTTKGLGEGELYGLTCTDAFRLVSALCSVLTKAAYRSPRIGCRSC